MEGLGCCAGINDYSTQHFYANSFLHNTSLAIAMDAEGKCYVTNKICNCGTILGWGKGIKYASDSD